MRGTVFMEVTNAVLGSAPFLTDMVRAMPTDRFVYLPFVMR